MCLYLIAISFIPSKVKFISKREEQSTKINYRPDVDGLRALSVLLVIFYHYNIHGFSGGFIGVDVFFVISGFLITGIIQNEVASGSFSLMNFYERRIRRITPPLFIMSSFSFIAAYCISMPSDFIRFGKSIISIAFMVPNIFFYYGSGYFQAEPISQPLLHTWSLGVEEQFYLFFPLAMVFLWIMARKTLIFGLFFFAASSLILNILFVDSGLFPLKAQDAAFYLTPFRAWQLCAGAILALKRPAIKSKRVKGILLITGIGLILSGNIAITSQTPFPGFRALFPVLGACCVIASDLRGSYNPLNWNLLVWLGKISYPMYLFHWPIIAFSQYLILPQNSFSKKHIVLQIIILVVASHLSWRYIEEPIRRKRVLQTRKRVYFTFLTCSLILIALGASVIAYSGFPTRFSSRELQLFKGASDINPRRSECHDKSIASIRRGDLCRLGKKNDQRPPKVLVWGDSHADAIMPVVDQLCLDYDIPAEHASRGGSAPFTIPRSQDRIDFLKAVEKQVVNKSYEYIVLVANWQGYFDNQEAKDLFSRKIEWLTSIGTKVILMINVPVLKEASPRALGVQVRRGVKIEDLHSRLSIHIDAISKSKGLFYFLANKFNKVTVIDPTHELSNDGNCILQDDGHSIYYSPGHLSNYGASLLYPTLQPTFSKIKANLARSHIN